MTERVRTLLLVEDDETFRTRLARALAERGFEVAEAASAEDALLLIEGGTPGFAVVDLRLPGRPGLDVVEALGAATPRPAIVVLTGYGSIATAVEAMRLGARDYLTKPAPASAIVEALLGMREEAPAPAPEVPSLSRLEWEHINRVLVECGGNVSQAARVLGLHRRSLQRKLAKRPLPR